MSAVSGLLRKFLLLELMQGMWITLRIFLTSGLRNYIKKDFTIEYPRVKPDLAPRFRGVPRLRRDPETTEQLCVGCLLCEQICPDDCISIVVDKRPGGKGKMAKSFIIDYERCCFCGLCVDPCPTTPITAIYMSHDYELSDYSRQQFIVPMETLLDGGKIVRYEK